MLATPTAQTSIGAPRVPQALKHAKMDIEAFSLSKEARRIVMLPPFARGRLGPVYFGPSSATGEQVCARMN